MINFKKHTFKNALNGLIHALKEHPNFKIHLTLALAVLILGYFLQIKLFEWLILWFSITLVIICELINTSIESVCDLVTLEYRTSIKIAKDVSAGMVLISAFSASVAGFIIFLPYLF